jgi:hypothetical protein
MGISPNREFLLPAPAADDLTLDAVGYDGAVALARKSSRRAHPAAISIDPPQQHGTAPVERRPTTWATRSRSSSVPTSAGSV